MFGLFSKNPARKRSKSRERSISYDRQQAPGRDQAKVEKRSKSSQKSDLNQATHPPLPGREHMREHVIEGDENMQREHRRELFREHRVLGGSAMELNNNRFDQADLNLSSGSKGHRQMVVSAEDVQEQRSRKQLRGRQETGNASEENKDIFRSARSRAGLNTVHTQRIIRKTTTLSSQQRYNVSLVIIVNTVRVLIHYLFERQSFDLIHLFVKRDVHLLLHRQSIPH
jgi:hypothetical protein